MNSAAWSVPPSTAVEERPVEEGSPPPMRGKGSSKSSWASYAEAHGVQVTPESTRADIIAALDQANIPTRQ